MRVLVFLSLFVLLGLWHAQLSGVVGEDLNAGQLEPEDSSTTTLVKRKDVKRVIRSAFPGMSNQLLLMEAEIISNCKVNGHTDSASELQDTYDALHICLKRKTLFITPKNEYLTNLEECSSDSIQKTKKCLTDEQKYFPEFILDLAKSIVTFLYDDFNLMKDVGVCARNFNKYAVHRDYVQCLTDIAIQSSNPNTIPTSKASFCKTFIPATYCFTDMIKDNCDRTANLDRFREDYNNASKRPCDK